METERWKRRAGVKPRPRAGERRRARAGACLSRLLSFYGITIYLLESINILSGLLLSHDQASSRRNLGRRKVAI